MAPARKKAKKLDAGDAFAQDVVEKLTCPITAALIVNPFVAEDGRVYEFDAIKRWLSSKKKSPLTNKAMGDGLVKCLSTRALIHSAIENGVCEGAAAAAWHLESAKAIAVGLLPGSMSSLKDHLERADALKSSKEIQLMLRAATLKQQEDALATEAADADIDGVAMVFVSDSYPNKDESNNPFGHCFYVQTGQSATRVKTGKKLQQSVLLRRGKAKGTGGTSLSEKITLG